MFLETIIAHKLQEVAFHREQRPMPEVRAEAESAPATLNFVEAIRRPAGKTSSRPRLIAEVKRASPSRGRLVPDFNPLRLARLYQKNGASAISVLTDERFFEGRLDYLSQVASLSPRLPALRKDFIIDPYQVYEARACGADAILLIVACLDLERLRDLSSLALDLGMASLVEIHNSAELETALSSAPQMVGINNRDLRTFATHLEVSLDLRPCIPAGIPVVAESGIHSRADVDRLAEAGVDAILVGEALVTAPDVAAAVRRLAA